MNESIYLRPLVLDDVTASYKWRNNPEVCKYTLYNLNEVITMEQETALIEESLKRSNQKSFAICLTKNEKHIGNINLIDIANQQAEVQLFIGDQDYWGKGISTKATKLILDYAFFTLNLNNIRFDVDKNNEAAIKIYTRQGFISLDSAESLMMMKITREDYLTNKKLSGLKYLITIDQELEWKNFVKRTINYDFYHSWTYHSLDSTGIPLLFVYKEGDNFIGIPLIKREIQDSEYFDLISVYGYSGPISNKDFHSFSPDFVCNFRSNFLDFLKDEKIVTVFSRLHPFFNQTDLMEEFGGVVDNGKVVVMDLSISLEEQRNAYRESFLRKIKQLRKKGFYVKEVNAEEDIKIFASIYKLNMLRIDASATYYFDYAYFKTLLYSDEVDARLLFVYDTNDYPVSGIIVVITNGIIQFHLLGTREEYLADSPAKLLIEEVTIIGRALGVKFFNLGGGLGFKEDSLFKWKTGFSHLTFDYRSWRFVANEKVYNSLLTKKEIEIDTEVDFFPLYRLQDNKA
ncbi:RimJ/RimL family protein N-acetyltransferase [Pedobacter sp. CAN_A7]|uniref:GNAT family N-acetyltransferase n=1 Tax=Pedobacter sp. CAN_A7 TaxID=2787722 RepID=UPI0018CB5E00